MRFIAFLDARILYGPGKAANAGGVAVSGLEQSQNALRIAWSFAEVDERLKAIMRDIHDKCREDWCRGRRLRRLCARRQHRLAFARWRMRCWPTGLCRHSSL